MMHRDRAMFAEATPRHEATQSTEARPQGPPDAILTAETTTMNTHKFSAEVARQSRVANAGEFFRSAAVALRERAYGDILVQTDWTPLASDDDIVRIDVTVTGDLETRHGPAYGELVFQDAFLLFNIALSGSFGGAITIGGDFRVNDLSFDAAPFACGAASVPLAEVVER